MVDRPFADKRPVGPFIETESSSKLILRHFVYISSFRIRAGTFGVVKERLRGDTERLKKDPATRGQTLPEGFTLDDITSLSMEEVTGNFQGVIKREDADFKFSHPSTDTVNKIMQVDVLVDENQLKSAESLNQNFAPRTHDDPIPEQPEHFKEISDIVTKAVAESVRVENTQQYIVCK